MDERRFWIGVVSEDGVADAAAGGFVEFRHGKAGPLERMAPGDGLALYSPRVVAPDGAASQRFTAIGRVREGSLWQVPKDGEPPHFRRAVEWWRAEAAPIRPLIDRLSFIRSKEHWGAPFRYGLVRIPAADFAAIAAAMGRSFAQDFGVAAQDAAAIST